MTLGHNTHPAPAGTTHTGPAAVVDKALGHNTHTAGASHGTHAPGAHTAGATHVPGTHAGVGHGTHAAPHTTGAAPLAHDHHAAGAHGAHGAHTKEKVPIGQKISGTVESAIGKATHNPVKVAEGEAKKGNVATGPAAY